MRLTSVFSLLAVVSLFSPAPPPPVPDPGAPGPYSVGHTSFTVVDPARDTGSPFAGRPVFVSVWYPVDPPTIAAETPAAEYPLDPFYRPWILATSAQWEQVGMIATHEAVPASSNGPFPLIVVSPGWGARYVGMFYYGPQLASHGFVVAVLQHYRDSPALDMGVADPIDTAMRNRPIDVSFAIDALLAKNGEDQSPLARTIDPELIAAMGHSLGGYAALVLAGGDDVVCGSPDDPLTDDCVPAHKSLPDARVKAIVALDAASQLLHFQELARIAVPSIGIGQAWERAGDWQARQHAAISAHPNYRADVLNTVHPSFGGNCATARVLFAAGVITQAQLKTHLAAPQCASVLPQPEVNRLAAKYAIAFLKTHLAGETGYQHILTPGWALTREPDVEFFVTEKGGTGTEEDWPEEFWYFPHQPGSARAHGPKHPVVLRPIEPDDR